MQVSELLYTGENKRTPKSILRFYNATWVHFELCRELLSTPTSITRRKMFGIYLHAITLHASIQYEIVNLRATNSEHEERLFGQAKDIARKATNRQPNTVILLRVQAKQKTGRLYNSYNRSSSRVSKAGNELYKDGGKTNNRTVTKDFLTVFKSSWQQHLSRISPFIKLGPGIA